MKCDFCEKNGFVQVEDENVLYSLLIEVMDECGLDEVSVVADEDVTVNLLYTAVNDVCNFGSIELDRWGYDGGYDDAYITTIRREYDYANLEEDFVINVDKARYEDTNYLATGNTTFIQYDLPCKCEYIEDVLNNKFIDDFDPEFFVIGDYNADDDKDENDEPEDNHDKTYTYANHVEGENSSGDIFIESTSKDFVDALKGLFDEYFGD